MSNRILTKLEMRAALEKAGCPEPLIDMLGEDLEIWWKAGWFQEILQAQAALSSSI